MYNGVKNQYIQQKRNRKRNFCHWKLGVMQMIQTPLLNVMLLPIVFLTIGICKNMDLAFALFDIPKVILPIYTITVKIIGCMIPLLLLWGLIDVMGSLTARKDETNLETAFNESELRNGSPVLMFKRKDKKSGVTVREYFSPIPMKVWISRKEEIQDAMNIHLVQDFRYGGKSNGNRIVMYSAEGREASSRGILYDEDF